MNKEKFNWTSWGIDFVIGTGAGITIASLIILLTIM